MANVQVTQVPVEVLLTADDARLQVTQQPVEVLIRNAVDFQWGTATSTVAMPDVGLRLDPYFVISSATASVDSNPVALDASFTTGFASATVEMPDVSLVIQSGANLTWDVATADVELIAPIISHTYAAPAGVLDAPQITDTVLEYTFSVYYVTASVEMPDVGFFILQPENFPVDPAEALVEMSDVGLVETPYTPPQPSPGVGPQIVADREEELFGLLTLRVESMRVRVEGGETRMRFYQAVKPRLRNLWKPKPRPVPYAVALVPQITFKVEPFNHLIFRVHPQPFVNFSVECTQVLFEERTSALWGELQVPGYLEEAKVLRSLFSKPSPIPTPSKIMRIRKR